MQADPDHMTTEADASAVANAFREVRRPLDVVARASANRALYSSSASTRSYSIS